MERREITNDVIRNVPVPTLSDAERAEIERKALEIETGKATEDVDEDDAGKQMSFPLSRIIRTSTSFRCQTSVRIFEQRSQYQSQSIVSE